MQGFHGRSRVHGISTQMRSQPIPTIAPFNFIRYCSPRSHTLSPTTKRNAEAAVEAAQAEAKERAAEERAAAEQRAAAALKEQRRMEAKQVPKSL